MGFATISFWKKDSKKCFTQKTKKKKTKKNKKNKKNIYFALFFPKEKKRKREKEIIFSLKREYMQLHLEKFVQTTNGKYLMSMLLGLGLATLFRNICDGDHCTDFFIAPYNQWKERIFKVLDKCVTYIPIPVKCDNKQKILSFE